MKIELSVFPSNMDSDLILGATKIELNFSELQTLTAEDKEQLSKKLLELKQFCIDLYQK